MPGRSARGVGRRKVIGLKKASSGVKHITVSGADLVYSGSPIKLRGVNNNNWPAYTMRNTADNGIIEGSGNPNDVQMSEADYAVLSSFGVNCVRFGVSHYWYKNTTNRPNFATMMAQQFTWAKQNRMWIIPIMFDNPTNTSDGCYEGYAIQVCPHWTDSGLRQQIVDFWVWFATQFKDEPGLAGYMPINEPAGTIQQLNTLLQAVITGIRTVDPNKVIFVQQDINGLVAPSGSNTWPYTGTNLAVEIHDYHPLRFTHSRNYEAEFNNIPPTWTGGSQSFLDYDGNSYSWHPNSFVGKDPSGNFLPDYGQIGGMTNVPSRQGIWWAESQNRPILFGEWSSCQWSANPQDYDAMRIGNFLNDYSPASGGCSHTTFMWRGYDMDVNQLSGFDHWGIVKYTTGVVLPNNPGLIDTLKAGWNGIRPDFGLTVSSANLQVPRIESPDVNVGTTLTVHQGIWRGNPASDTVLRLQKDTGGNGVYNDIGTTEATQVGTSDAYSGVKHTRSGTAKGWHRLTYVIQAGDAGCHFRASGTDGTTTVFSAVTSLVPSTSTYNPVTSLGSIVIAVYDMTLGSGTGFVVDANGLSGGIGKLSQIKDISGNNRHLVHATNGWLVDMTGMDGKPCAYDDENWRMMLLTGVSVGTNKVAAYASCTYEGPANAGQNDARLISFAGNGQTIDYGNSNSAAIIMRRAQTSAITAYRSPTGYLGTAAFTVGSTTKTFWGEFDGTNYTPWVGGTAGTAAASSANFSSPGTIMLGTADTTTGVGPWNGALKRLILTNAPIPAAERTNVQTWLLG